MWRVVSPFPLSVCDNTCDYHALVLTGWHLHNCLVGLLVEFHWALRKTYPEASDIVVSEVKFVSSVPHGCRVRLPLHSDLVGTCIFVWFFCSFHFAYFVWEKQPSADYPYRCTQGLHEAPSYGGVFLIWWSSREAPISRTVCSHTRPDGGDLKVHCSDFYKFWRGMLLH